MTKIEFDKWVDEMGKKFYYDNNVYKNYIDGRGDDRGVIIMYNFKNQKVGIARCHPNDTFVYKIGVAIAYARCKGYEVPKISTYKKLSEMKNGDKFYIDGVEHFFVGKSTALVRNRDYYAIIDIKEDTIFRFEDSGKAYEMVE